MPRLSAVGGVVEAAARPEQELAGLEPGTTSDQYQVAGGTAALAPAAAAIPTTTDASAADAQRLSAVTGSPRASARVAAGGAARARPRRRSGA